jgi:eukaryotic-like serine/threonine-protein kinase
MEPGTQFLHYCLLERIGKGGMGEVLLAEDTVLRRRVALKFLSEHLSSSAGARRRLAHEARAAAALDHPFICKTYETGERDGAPFIAMEYVEGQTLRQHLAEGPTRIDEGLRVALEIADALQYAHAHGIIHCDLKPANIMLTPDGHVKVMDFGLAKDVRTAGGGPGETHFTLSTATGMTPGTPAYMSPEQLLGQPLDARSDIFAFGVVLYEMLAGAHPFRKNSAVSTVNAILSDEPRPIEQWRHDVPDCVTRSLERMLSKNREVRQPDMTAVRANLKWALETSLPGRNVRKARRHRWRLLAPLVAAAALIVALAWLAAVSTMRREPAVAFRTRDWLVLADVENQTGDRLFDRSLDRTLAVGIQQSREVNVIARSQIEEVLRRMGRKNVTTLDEASADEVALREGARAVLACSIGQVGEEYVLTARLLDPATHSTLLTRSAKATSRTDVLAALEELMSGMRGHLRESLRSIAQQKTVLPKATTTSFEALSLYDRGLRLPEGGNDLIEQAVALDPDFALAHAELGAHYYRIDNPAVGEEHFKKALALLDRLTVRERLWIEALAEDSRGTHEVAVTEYREYLADYPDDLHAWLRLGSTLMALERREEAIAAFKRMLETDPGSSIANLNIASCCNRLRKDAESLRHYALAFKQDPRCVLGDSVNHEYGFLLVRTGKVEQARATFQKMIDAPERAKQAIGLRSVAVLEMFQGRCSLAAQHMTNAAALRHLMGDYLGEFGDHLQLVSTYAMVGRGSDTAAQLAFADRIASAHRLGPSWLLDIGARYARLGDLRAAHRILAIATDSVRDRTAASGVNRGSRDARALDLLKGEIDLAAGRAAEAFDLFDGALRRATGGAGGPDPRVARALVALGRFAEAKNEYEGIVGCGFLGSGNEEEWLVAHLELGKVYERLGDTAKAREYYQRLLTFWKDGDPDLRPLVEAKERLNALGRAPGH